jgi:rhamnogalacturonyl hydrolase YesR
MNTPLGRVAYPYPSQYAPARSAAYRRSAALAACLIAAILAATGLAARQVPSTDPLAVARILAAKYPAQPIMSYIPALSWSNSMRLSTLTGEPRWRENALKDIEAFTSGRTPAIAEPYRLTSFAGAQAFADAAAMTGIKDAGALAQKVANFIVPANPDDVIRFATGWTDDMFMATSVLARTGNGAAVGKLLLTYAGKLQRPDGIYIHAVDGPHAWGRGNGFALLGVTEALTHLPETWSDRPRVLEIYRKHVAAMAKLQSDDGSWRQVVDEPTSYRELTVTAMTTAAIARGVRLGWIDRATYEPIVARGWTAVAARVNPDGTVRNVCSGTGVGPTKEYYLNRPEVNGADDRGGAMALLASIEVAMLKR